MFNINNFNKAFFANEYIGAETNDIIDWWFVYYYNVIYPNEVDQKSYMMNIENDSGCDSM